MAGFTFRRCCGTIGLLAAATVLAACGQNEQFKAFSKANNTARISAPVADDLWAALDCSAAEHANQNGFALFSRADITMQVADGFAQPPAVLTNSEGDRRAFSVYGFYNSEEEWQAAKDERIGALMSPDDLASCG